MCIGLNEDMNWRSFFRRVSLHKRIVGLKNPLFHGQGCVFGSYEGLEDVGDLTKDAIWGCFEFQCHGFDERHLIF